MTTNLPRNEEGKILLGDIPVGEAKTFDVVFNPPEDTEFGYHDDYIILKGTNSEQEFRVNLYALVTSNLKGSVQFHVTNILGQDVEEATIRMRNTAIREDITPVKTDANGEVVVTGLQEGKWSWQVVASGHSSLSGLVTVVADQIVLVDPMLSRSLVTINFIVEPVPFTDRYEIKIEQTFETHVPVPVLVVDPSYVEFKNVTPGFEVNFLVTVTNYGLVKLHDLTISSDDDGTATLEPLISYVPELAAMQSMEIPYRLTYYGEEEPAPLLATFSRQMSSSDSGSSKSGDGAGDWLANCLFGGKDFAKGLAALASKFGGFAVCGADNTTKLKVAAGLLALGQTISLSELGAISSIIGCALAELFGTFDMDWGEMVGEGTSYLTPTNDSPINPPCFVAGTPILMADGSTKPIEEIHVGDKVMAFNGESDRVKRLHKRESDHVREIWYYAKGGESRRLETTDGHLFWVDGKEWTPARKVEIGDCLMTVKSDKCKVVRNERFSRTVRVYNFDVDTYRSYFAGGVLVHERCGMMKEDPVKMILPKSRKTG
jgi:hypothetical protein